MSSAIGRHLIKALSLSSVTCMSKKDFVECPFLILGKVYLIFFLFVPNFFVVWSYMFNFGMLIEVFAIPIRFISFN
jgi:hypothetical protein